VRLYAYDGASAFDLADAKAHGAVLITGYIVGHPGGMDPITAQRVHQIHALGMGFLPNWERGASYLVTASHAQALTAGNEAVAALRALSVPDDGTIACPFSWDVNVAPSQYAQCGAVADGIIEALAGRYLFTAYGQGGLIDYFARTGRLQSDGWLSASSSFPGYDAASPRVALVQRVGSPVPGTDQDIVTDVANVHAWWPPGSPYASTPVTPTLQEQIVSLDRNSADYKAFIADVAAAAQHAADNPMWGSNLPGDKRYGPDSLIRGIMNEKFALFLNPAKLAASIAAALPPSTAATPDQLEAAVRAVFADAATP
jgi:hypothetical protein